MSDTELQDQVVKALEECNIPKLRVLLTEAVITYKLWCSFLDEIYEFQDETTVARVFKLLSSAAYDDDAKRNRYFLDLLGASISDAKFQVIHAVFSFLKNDETNSQEKFQKTILECLELNIQHQIWQKPKESLKSAMNIIKYFGEKGVQVNDLKYLLEDAVVAEEFIARQENDSERCEEASEFLQYIHSLESPSGQSPTRISIANLAAEKNLPDEFKKAIEYKRTRECLRSNDNLTLLSSLEKDSIDVVKIFLSREDLIDDTKLSNVVKKSLAVSSMEVFHVFVESQLFRKSDHYLFWEFFALYSLPKNSEEKLKKLLDMNVTLTNSTFAAVQRFISKHHVGELRCLLEDGRISVNDSKLDAWEKLVQSSNTYVDQDGLEDTAAVLFEYGLHLTQTQILRARREAVHSEKFLRILDIAAYATSNKLKGTTTALLLKSPRNEDILRFDLTDSDVLELLGQKAGISRTKRRL